MPKVSVIMPMYNAQAYISAAIESVLSQTFTDWEMLIVDDCSRDNSSTIVERYASQDRRITLLRLQTNQGVAAARNKAIMLARGKYIAFLDSDDLWLPTKLEKQINFMSTNNVSFSHTAYKKINASGKHLVDVIPPQQIEYKQLLKTNYIGCLTAIYDQDMLGKVLMPTNTKREDFATWLTLLKQTPCVYALTEVLAAYRIYDAQSSAKKMKMAQETWNIYRRIENLGLIKSSYYFANYALMGFLRTNTPKLAKLFKAL